MDSSILPRNPKVESTREKKALSGPFYRIHPMYERLRHLRGAVIIIEGIIGAGKSTYARKLHQLLNKVGIPSQLLEEEVDPYMLDLFLSDMKKYAFAFQMLMLAQRQKIYIQGLDFARRENGVVIIDRSLYGDMAFAMMHVDYGNISGVEWKAYESIMSSALLPQPSNILYLEVTPETALERIQARNRGKEVSSYNIQYLYDLDINYKVAMEESRIPIQYIDWNTPSNLSDEEVAEICDLINPHG